MNLNFNFTVRLSQEDKDFIMSKIADAINEVKTSVDAAAQRVIDQAADAPTPDDFAALTATKAKADSILPPPAPPEPPPAQ